MLTEQEIARIYGEMDSAVIKPFSFIPKNKLLKPSEIALKYRGKSDEEVREIFAKEDAEKNAALILEIDKKIEELQSKKKSIQNIA